MYDEMKEPTRQTEAATHDPQRPRGAHLVKAFTLRLPAAPGVYRMLDDKGDVLYVGKAKNLRARVTAYTKLGGHTQRIALMITQTADMEFVRTASETEALLLEANLIKRLKPRYNIILRDDKSFAEILVRGDHDFPQILKHRGSHATKGRYFGPFASAGAVNRALNTLQRAFLLRSCSDSVFENRTRPCLLYQIKRCSAPCVGHIDQAAYQRLVEDATDFLEGRDARVKAGLNTRMNEAATALDFESAANYRDRIRALAHLQIHQGINPQTVKDADVVALHCEGGQSCIEVFFFRAGQNWGNRAYFPRHDKSEAPEEVLDAFLAQFYDNKLPPPVILLSQDAPGQALLAEALSIKAERKIEINVPRRGEKRALVEHALANAKDALARRFAESASQAKLLAAVAEAFDLAEPPRRIEVYDNSHIMGAHAVGGMIVAGPDGFEKGQYRKFNIKSADLTPGDDYGMMREVLRRRFTRLLKAEESGGGKDGVRPDLVLIDGGAGQLSSALEVLTELGATDIPLVAIAKGPDRNSGAEQFFAVGAAPRRLEPRSGVLYYLERLRDEAHRFAIGTHRARRGKTMSETSLDDVPGIGAARKRALLAHFGSAKGVERAGIADLEAVPGVSRAIAKRIHDFYHGQE
jgi:excinuclease ABC subunit C